MLVIDTLIAVAVPLLQSFFDAHVTLPALLRQYLYSVIYANLIGLPLCLALPPIWMRSSRWPVLSKGAIRAAVVLIANFLGCLVAGLMLRAMIGSNYQYWPEFRSSFGLSLVLSAIVVSFVTMYETQESRLKHTATQLKTKELERERALKLATEARLSSLESRIHPHFLFNTINSVSSLIHEDPLGAERILTQLAELLRFSLDAAPGGLVPLERELQIVENYLEIERTRFGDRLRYEIDIPAEFRDAAVPPFSLQTLVENSVKYAAGPRGKGASVRVSATVADGRLFLAVRDDGPGFASLELPTGHGLNNLQERLLALFGENGQLSVFSNQSETTVLIETPYHASAFRPAPGLQPEAAILPR